MSLACLRVKAPAGGGPGDHLAVALGLGSQRIVQDILAGFFVITERHQPLVRLGAGRGGRAGARPPRTSTG